MSAPNLRLLRQDVPEDERPSIDAARATLAQTDAAEDALFREPEAWLHMPWWPQLDAMVEGIGDGEVWFVGGFSGAGKTTWLMNLVQPLLVRDLTVYYLGLETKPQELRTRLACAREGVYVGDVLSGKAARTYTHWPSVRARLAADIRTQRALGPGNRFLVCPAEQVDADAMTAAFYDAAIARADLLVIDHIDHATHGGGRSGFDDSRMLSRLVFDLAQQTGIRTMVATQFNNEPGKGDPLGHHRPPQPHHVYMGGHKRQIAWGMLGLYKPLRDNVTPALIKAARAGIIRTKSLVEPNVMAVSCMKHRHHGAHEGDEVRLRFDRGLLQEIDPQEPTIVAPLREESAHWTDDR